MKKLILLPVFISVLFSCKKDDVTPIKETRSFILTIDEQFKTSSSCGKLCYFSDDDKSKIDTIKFCSFGLNTFNVNIRANKSITFYMSGKPERVGTRIDHLDGLKQFNTKHVSSAKWPLEIVHVKSIY